MTSQQFCSFQVARPQDNSRLYVLNPYSKDYFWIDADAVPNDVKEIVLRASRRLAIETILVANKDVWIGDDPLVSLVRVDAGPDVADQRRVLELVRLEVMLAGRPGLARQHDRVP